MKVSEINAVFAGKELTIGLHFRETEAFFRSYGFLPAESREEDKIILTDPEGIETSVTEWGCRPDFAEFNNLALDVGNELTHWDRIIFHSVAFLHGGEAYLLTAPSGTGKSTQYRNLRTLFGEDYRIINGDKPVLAMDPEGRIRVCPSPWRGKEGWGSRQSAVLKGVFLLAQGKENRLYVPEEEEAIPALLSQVLFSSPDLESVKTACRFIDRMIRQVYVYRFVNTGDAGSSRMLDALIRSLEKKEDEVQSS